MKKEENSQKFYKLFLLFFYIHPFLKKPLKFFFAARRFHFKSSSLLTILMDEALFQDWLYLKQWIANKTYWGSAIC
jgi:hypothetical protein